MKKWKTKMNLPGIKKYLNNTSSKKGQVDPFCSSIILLKNICFHDMNYILLKMDALIQGLVAK